jgi:hypothetical protein
MGSGLSTVTCTSWNHRTFLRNISTDYPHFDSNFPNVSSNLLKTVPRDIAAQIFMGGAHLYGFTDTDFEQAAAAAKRGTLTTAAVGV